jgi:hypothetical protein
MKPYNINPNLQKIDLKDKHQVMQGLLEKIEQEDLLKKLRECESIGRLAIGT